MTLPRHVGTLAAAIALATGVALVPGAAEATPWPGHPDRTIVRHVVRPGETATALAVRFHAWTDELLRLNHLGTSTPLYVGHVIRIPVVISAVRRAHGRPPVHRTVRHHPPKHATRHHVKHHHVKRHHARKPLLMHTGTPKPRGWLHANLSRTAIRHLVSRMAHHFKVPRTLMLAIAWQESGWQERRVSSAGAIGVMQVLPDTGRWMRWYAGRTLRLHDTHDNVEAGVLTMKVLRSWTRYDNTAIAAYYQGLGAVRKHGYYRDTKRYVRSVRAIQRHIIRTGEPV